MPRQLPLDISPAPEPTFDSFIAGANAEALERVRALAAGKAHEAIVYLWGEAGSGRSHLLRAAARENPALVVADDVERLDAPDQQALFLAINAARERLDRLDERIALVDVDAGVAVGQSFRHARVSRFRSF